MKQKKRNQGTPAATSSVTLLDYFKAKPVTTPTPTKKSARARANSKAGGSKRPQEVIVISDTDDDDDIEVVDCAPSKRRKLSASPAPPAAENTPPTSKYLPDDVRARQNATRKQSPTRSPPLQENDQNVESGSSQSMFGIPVLLGGKPVGRWAETKPQVPPLEMPRQKTPFAPQPQPEASGSTTKSRPTSSCVPSSSSTLPVKHENSGDVDIDMTLGEWGLGDDEGANPVPDITPKYEDESFDDTLATYDDSVALEDEKEESMDTCLSSNQQASGSGGNAFSVLMSSFRDNEAWTEASKVEDDKTRPSKANGGRRKAPFYKVLQGMPIAVDAFRYGDIPGVTAYFLTHAHSDHYTNLSSSWKHGPIYCSEGTANLIIHMLKVDKKWVHPLPMDTPTVVPNTQGVTVTLIEANHCPGSCLFFFEGRQSVNAGDSTFKSSYVGSTRVFRYLHCGDFRASPKHVLHPAVKGKVIDHVYLDTTYLDPKYTFPPQPLVIDACANLAKKIASGEPINESSSAISSWFTTTKGKGKEPAKPTLFVVGTYSIGKERIVKAVAKAVGSKIYCDKRKADILRCQDDPELHSLLTDKSAEASVHLLPLGMITSDKLKPYLERFNTTYSKVVGLRPTGWTYVQPSGTDQQPTVNAILSRTVQKTFTAQDLKPNGKSTSTVQMYPVPYSEHSSFYELTCFAMSFNWTKMIATVNVGSERTRGKMAGWVAKWEAERRRRGKIEIVAHRHIEYW